MVNMIEDMLLGRYRKLRIGTMWDGEIRWVLVEDKSNLVEIEII